MNTVPEPTNQRTAEQIYDDFEAVLVQVLSYKAPDFWQRRAEQDERLRELWGELAGVVLHDPAVPVWARVAAALARDYYADNARNAHARAVRRR